MGLSGVAVRASNQRLRPFSDNTDVNRKPPETRNQNLTKVSRTSAGDAKTGTQGGAALRQRRNDDDWRTEEPLRCPCERTTETSGFRGFRGARRKPPGKPSLTVFDCQGISATRRQRIESAVAAAGARLAQPYEPGSPRTRSWAASGFSLPGPRDRKSGVLGKGDRLI